MLQRTTSRRETYQVQGVNCDSCVKSEWVRGNQSHDKSSSKNADSNHIMVNCSDSTQHIGLFSRLNGNDNRQFTRLC